MNVFLSWYKKVAKAYENTTKACKTFDKTYDLEMHFFFS